MSQTRQDGENDLSPFVQKNEKQSIIRELKNRDMFENGMSVPQMKDLLKVILESEKAAKIPSDLKATENKAVEPSAPPAPISYAEKLSASLPSTSERKSTSPEQTLAQSDKSPSQERQPDSPDETIFSSNFYPKETKVAQNSNINLAHQSTSFEGSSDGKNDNKQTNYGQYSKPRRNAKYVRLRINPLDPSGKFKDVPLYRSYDAQARDQSSGSGGCESDDAGPSDNDDKVIARLCNHLRQVANIYQRRSYVETNFQWGSAIKIGETNGSNDRKIINDDETTEFNDETINPRDTAGIGAVNETNRRRRICTNKPATYEYDDGSNDEKDNSDQDFVVGAKRKKIVASTAGKKATSTKTGTRKTVETVATSETTESTSIEVRRDDSEILIDVSDDYTITDDETNGEPPKKLQRSKSAEAEPVYPRRIVPPSTGTKWSGIRARKPLFGASSQPRAKRPNDEEDNDENSRSARPRKSNSSSSLGLKAEEIVEALEEEEDDGNDGVTPLCGDTAEIRPLRVSSRMKIQGQRLAQLQERDKENERNLREQEIFKKEKIRRETMERIQHRVREGKEKLRLQDELDMHQAQREEEWRHFVQLGDKKRQVERTDIHPDGRPQNNQAFSGAQENNFMMSQDEDEFISDNGGGRETNRVRCPICNRGFTSDEIEAHAGACEEYDSCPPGISRSSSPSLTPTKIVGTSQRSNSSPLFECEVCARFTTFNGKQYENHMSECLRRKKLEQHNTPDVIVEVPTSPLRTVRTISEQTDSEINYKTQFVPKTKSNKTIGKKRKR